MWRHLWRHYDIICESSNQMPERLHHTHVTCASLLIGCAPLPHSKNSYSPSYPYPLKASSPNSIPYLETEWQFLLPQISYRSRVAGTMVARLPSVQAVTRSNLSQVPPLLMHVGKWPAELLAAKRLAHVAPELNLRERITYASAKCE